MLVKRFVQNNIPVHLDFQTVQSKLMVTEEEDVALIRSLYEQALEIAQPKSIVRICYVDSIEGDDVTIEGTTFTSHTLAKNLADVGRTFAYVVTCGQEVDEWSHKEKDPFVSLWLDMIKELILMDAQAQVMNGISETYDLKKYATINPGSGDADVWPIAQQRGLFALIGDVQKDSGVVLEPSFLMTPTKSVSGILFPTDRNYVNCAMCKRLNCPNRKAPYNPDILLK